MYSSLLVLLLACSVNAISIQDHCDEHVYEKFYRPKFIFNPKPYILPYYKRCIHNEDWVRCIENVRMNPMKNVTVRPQEKRFPPKLALQAAGIVFCDMRLHKVPPNSTHCPTLDRKKCDKLDFPKDPCHAGLKRVECLWPQYQKCHKSLMEPIKEYELGSLGGDCLKKLKLVIKPYSHCENERSSDDYLGKASDPGDLSPSHQGSILLIAVCSILAYFSPAKGLFGSQ